ncbi:hypothetical protein MKW98_026836, partial [Papaver atlanticum]
IVPNFVLSGSVTNTYICSDIFSSPSMLPTLSLTGDLVFGEKISPHLGKVNNGDIVLVRSPENPKKTLTKCILGMEGDNLPKWIQGDDIYASNDSCQFCPVPYGLIQSKLFCRLLFLYIWPISGFGSLGQEV